MGLRRGLREVFLIPGEQPMKKEKTKPDNIDLTWPLVLSVAGVTLMRSQSVLVQTLGASLTTLSLIKGLKKLSAMV